MPLAFLATWAHCWLIFRRLSTNTPRFFSARQLSSIALYPKPVALHGVAVAQVQDLALSLVEPHTIGLSPSIQPVQAPLQSLPTLQQINTPAQLGVVCKLTEGALDPLIEIIDKDIKQNWILLNPFWQFPGTLFFVSLDMISRRICSIFIPGTETKLTSL
ncbi:hypothetical protein QYF61_017798 [Mycteria americana]|uniref:Uncharacterized protein n=1 Tax=Mycteria americana TaxID=33587 RepID=A0AAN7PKC1_MYCAM|nr:hypothetical protein QYF61_017798 [Mycteria americana]